MTIWPPHLERERACAAVIRCAGELRQAQEHAGRVDLCIRRVADEIGMEMRDVAQLVAGALE